MSERLRLFVALDLPAAAREALAAWCERVAPAGLRRIPAHDLHLTLAFLGSRVERDAVAVAGLLPGLARAHSVGPLRTTRALWLGPRRPSVLTVAVGDGDELTALRGALVAALAAAVGFEASGGRFARTSPSDAGRGCRWSRARSIRRRR